MYSVIRSKQLSPMHGWKMPMSFWLELNLNICTRVPQKLRGFAQRDKGPIIICFDPTKQSIEFVENILNDLDARGIKGEIAAGCVH